MNGQLESGTELANTEQAEVWNRPARVTTGPNTPVATTGPVDATASACSKPPLISPTDVVLDVGCGTGSTTRGTRRGRATHGSAFGVDLSAATLDQAREQSRTEGIPNVRRSCRPTRRSTHSRNTRV